MATNRLAPTTAWSGLDGGAFRCRDEYAGWLLPNRPRFGSALLDGPTAVTERLCGSAASTGGCERGEVPTARARLLGRESPFSRDPESAEGSAAWIARGGMRAPRSAPLLNGGGRGGMRTRGAAKREGGRGDVREGGDAVGVVVERTPGEPEAGANVLGRNENHRELRAMMGNCVPREATSRWSAVTSSHASRSASAT
jgi:hypothetical protein